MDYNQILPELYIGSHPRSAEDIQQLKRQIGATAVLSVQTDDDLNHLNVSWPALESHYAAHGIEVRRCPIRDFDAVDLRARLADCVQALDRLLAAGHTVYLHCTAGAGRSPSVAIAYLVSRRGWALEDAIAHVTQCRQCSPNLDVLRDFFSEAGREF